LLCSYAASQRGLSGSQRRSRRNSSATAAAVPTINLQSDELLLCHRTAIATAAPSSIPTDCSAMVADDGHVNQKGRLSTEAIGRRPANDRTDHGTENQGRTDEANHERAER